jgi:hypothetical protein
LDNGYKCKTKFPEGETRWGKKKKRELKEDREKETEREREIDRQTER